MIRCSAPDCDSRQPDIGRLAAHLVEIHCLSAAVALQRAREAAGLPTDRPAPLRPLAPRAETQAPAERRCVEPTCGRALGEDRHRRCISCRRGPCRNCLKVAPDACARHGGPAHSGYWRGRQKVGEGCGYCRQAATGRCKLHRDPFEGLDLARVPVETLRGYRARLDEAIGAKEKSSAEESAL